VPTLLGAHNARVDEARDLLTKKGRKAQGRFSFEGPTLLQEAREAGAAIDAIYATRQSYERFEIVAELERENIPVYVVDERSMRRISDVDTPSGIVALARAALRRPADILASDGTVLLLADVNDPGNVGTLLRTAEAFGVSGILAGSLGAEPYLPKVVRAAMGAVFRLPIALAAPETLRGLVGEWEFTGLTARGEPLERLKWRARSILAVGNERHGLGRWDALCTRLASIPMHGKAESLNAAVAGAIALYEATKRPFC
jgi:TrmH family RNA methyltransferase